MKCKSSPLSLFFTPHSLHKRSRGTVPPPSFSSPLSNRYPVTSYRNHGEQDERYGSEDGRRQGTVSTIDNWLDQITVANRELTITNRIPESVRARRRHDDGPAANGQDHRVLRETAQGLHRNEEGIEIATGDL